MLCSRELEANCMHACVFDISMHKYREETKNSTCTKVKNNMYKHVFARDKFISKFSYKIDGKLMMARQKAITETKRIWDQKSYKICLSIQIVLC